MATVHLLGTSPSGWVMINDGITPEKAPEEVKLEGQTAVSNEQDDFRGGAEGDWSYARQGRYILTLSLTCIEYTISGSGDINQISKKIFLGMQPLKCHLDYLKVNQISHVLTLLTQEELNHPVHDTIKDWKMHSIEQLRIPVPDGQALSYDDFKSSLDFIEDIVKKPEGKVLIHCRGGVGRSASVAGAYFALLEDKPVEETEYKVLERIVAKLLTRRNQIRMSTNQINAIVDFLQKYRPLFTPPEERESIIRDVGEG